MCQRRDRTRFLHLPTYRSIKHGTSCLRSASSSKFPRMRLTIMRVPCARTTRLSHLAMLDLDEDGGSAWLHGVVDCASDIVCQALLRLQAPRTTGQSGEVRGNATGRKCLKLLAAQSRPTSHEMGMKKPAVGEKTQ